MRARVHSNNTCAVNRRPQASPAQLWMLAPRPHPWLHGLSRSKTLGTRAVPPGPSRPPSTLCAGRPPVSHWGGGNLPGSKKHEVQRPSRAPRCFHKELRPSVVSPLRWGWARQSPRAEAQVPTRGTLGHLSIKPSQVHLETLLPLPSQGNGPCGPQSWEDASPTETPAASQAGGPRNLLQPLHRDECQLAEPRGSTGGRLWGTLGSSGRACQGRRSEATEAVPAGGTGKPSVPVTQCLE